MGVAEKEYVSKDATSKKNSLLDPGFEPGLPRPQRGVLTSRLIEQVQAMRAIGSGGDAGFRSRCLSLAKRPLFRLSYTPATRSLNWWW